MELSSRNYHTGNTDLLIATSFLAIRNLLVITKVVQNVFSIHGTLFCCLLGNKVHVNYPIGSQIATVCMLSSSKIAAGGLRRDFRCCAFRFKSNSCGRARMVFQTQSYQRMQLHYTMVSVIRSPQ